MGENEERKPAWYGVRVPLVCAEDAFDCDPVEEPDELRCLDAELFPPFDDVPGFDW